MTGREKLQSIKAPGTAFGTIFHGVQAVRSPSREFNFPTDAWRKKEKHFRVEHTTRARGGDQFPLEFLFFFLS